VTTQTSSVSKRDDTYRSGVGLTCPIGSDRVDLEVHVLGWLDDVNKITLENTNFRTVIHTGQHTQLTLMSLEVGEEIGWEAHSHLDQFLRLEQGKARVDFGSSEESVDESHDVGDDWAFIVPAGVWHNVVNTGDEPVKLYSLYSPPEHPDGTVHRTKAEADAAEDH
jgi:mannose-6-phosphate isomerase-like protein (cupin superfamily)